jgi:hypothetical protein
MIHIVTIKQKIQLYKGEEPANAIELIQLEEMSFELISAKDRFQVGDKALLVESDYNLPDTDFWKDWTAPGGDPKKSKLGSHNRIRAVKFNLHRGDGLPVYSNGILLSEEDIKQAPIPAKLKFSLRSECTEAFLKNLATVDLGIYKYEAPERTKGNTGQAGASREFPVGLYKTDEPNINKINLPFPIQLVGSEKLDGSSITIYAKDGKSGICSRNLEKPLKYFKKTGFDKSWKAWFWSLFGYDRAIYTEIESESEFVNVGKPYLDKLVEYCNERKLSVALRGELVGKGASNGSGNNNNPHSKIDPTIYFFGADWYFSNAERMTHEDYINLVIELGFQHPTIVFNQVFESREELLKTCEDYFANNMIEGIVVRSLDGKYSAKVLSLEYDARK